MTDPSFRLATSDDIDAVVELVESAYRGERSRAGWCTEADLIDGQRVDPDMLGESLATDGVAILLLIDDEGAPVAERRAGEIARGKGVDGRRPVGGERIAGL